MTLEPPEVLEVVAASLTALGLSTEQLNSIKLSRKHRDRSMDEWPLSWDPSIPMEAIPELPSLMRRYALLRFALVDGSIENSLHVSEAFALISNEKIGAFAAEGFAYFNRQKRPRSGRAVTLKKLE